MTEIKLTDFARRGFSRMILVEGKEDANFIYDLLEEMQLRDKIFVYKVDGKDKFNSTLTALLLSSEFENLSHLAIIRDADFNTDAVASIRQSLSNANKRHTRHQFPIPDVAETFAGDVLKLAFFIFPQSGVEGMLETLLIDALADDEIMACVGTYIECLKSTGMELKNHILPKAKVRVFLAGNALDTKNPGADSKAWEVEHMFSLKRWNWNHSALDRIKTFLRQLAE